MINLIREYKLARAFKALFMENGKLKPDAEIVLAFLRDAACAKGAMTESGSSLLYDANDRFDNAQAAMIIGKRRMFDLIVKYLALNEIEIFNLINVTQSNSDETLIENLNI